MGLSFSIPRHKPIPRTMCICVCSLDKYYNPCLYTDRVKETHKQLHEVAKHTYHRDTQIKQPKTKQLFLEVQIQNLNLNTTLNKQQSKPNYRFLNPSGIIWYIFWSTTIVLGSSMPTLPAARNHQIVHSNFEWAIGNTKQSLGMNDLTSA
jgi:hypothetical protein